MNAFSRFFVVWVVALVGISVQAGEDEAPAPASKGPIIQVHVDEVIGPASSYVLATNRNHVAQGWKNGPAKLERLKELRPRWGAGRYMYRIGHGPVDGRNDYHYMPGYHFEKHWDKEGPYPYDDLRHALKDANTLDAEQIHVVNYGTGTAEEAARYVSYLNNPDDENRKTYPFPVQNVTYFEIGNEVSWGMVRGHKEHAASDKQYATRAKEFAQAMRKASPIPIKIGAVAGTNSNWLGEGWSGGAATVKNILEIMGEDVDFLIYHGYPSWPLKKEGDLLTIMAQNAWNDQKLTKEIVPAIKKHQKKPVAIANTEFFTELYKDAKVARGMFGALYSADTIALAFNHSIIVANQFCFDHQDLADASFWYKEDPTRVTAIFMLQKLLAQNWGDTVVKSSIKDVPTIPVQGASTKFDMPALAVAAAKAKDGIVYVLVVNRTNDKDVAADVALGFKPASARAHALKGTQGWSSGEGDVALSTADIAFDAPVTFPRASITILEVKP